MAARLDTPIFEQISAVFYPEDHNVEGLVRALRHRGVSEDDLTVLKPRDERSFVVYNSSKAPEGACFGAVVCGGLGALLGGILISGSVMIGEAAFLSGPLVGAVLGGGMGAMAGGLLGAIGGLSTPEHEIRFYEDALRNQQSVLVVAHVVKSQAKEIRAVFERFGGHHLAIRH